MKIFLRLLSLVTALVLTACAITSPDIQPTRLIVPTRIANATQGLPPTAPAPNATVAPLVTAPPTVVPTSAHTSTSTLTPSPTFTLSATSVQPTFTPTLTQTPTSTFTPAPTLTPTATPQPVGFGFIARVNPKESPAGALEISTFEGVKVAADSFALRVDAEYIGAGEIDSAVKKLADGKHPVIVIVGNDFAEATRKVATTYPFVKFIGVNQPAEDLTLPNLYLVQVRTDEEGFIAGLVSGYITKARVLSILVPNNDNLEAKRYSNGFIQGVRYSCGICQTIATPFDTERDTAVAVFPRLQRQKVDVVVPALIGEIGADVTKFGVTTGGVWVIGLGRDFGNTLSSGTERLALSVLRKSDGVVEQVVKSAMKGEAPKPVLLTAANGSLRLSAKFSPELSPAVTQLIKDSFDLLATGALDIGVDFASGDIR